MVIVLRNCWESSYFNSLHNPKFLAPMVESSFALVLGKALEKAKSGTDSGTIGSKKRRTLRFKIYPYL
jgi:hypothetical protein